jgi:single-stranded-DNA-specific exonuclease
VHLTGCGVAFLLWYGLAEKKGLPEEDIASYLDLVAISTCADAVSLLGENRVLVALGLQQIQHHELRPGLDALLANVNLHPQQTPFPLDAHRIVYSIAPRLNAAGRMAEGNLSVRLLMAESLKEAQPLADQLEDLNNRRRDLDQAITAEALEMIRGTEGGENAPATVLFHPDWSLGVLGITASRLLEHFPRPTIVLTEHEGKLTGSARSGPGFDVYQALSQCADLLDRFGGHSYAAGLSMPKENLGLFMVRFSQIAYEGKLKASDTAVPARMQSEAHLNFRDVTPQLCRWMEAMAPFGPGNTRPLFKADHLMMLEESRILYHKVTKQPNHMMLLLADKEGYVLEAAGWGMAKLWDRVSAQGDISMTFHLELYRNRDQQMMPRLVVRHLDV